MEVFHIYTLAFDVTPLWKWSCSPPPLPPHSWVLCVLLRHLEPCVWKAAPAHPSPGDVLHTLCLKDISQSQHIEFEGCWPCLQVHRCFFSSSRLKMPSCLLGLSGYHVMVPCGSFSRLLVNMGQKWETGRLRVTCGAGNYPEHGNFLPV